MASLKLGSFDKDQKLDGIKEHLSKLHHDMGKNLSKNNKFRDEGKWFGLKSTESDRVRKLEEFLKKSGFMPFQEPNGIFDYFTLASVRLFQEYVLRVEKKNSVGVPDGIAGAKFFAEQEIWEKEGKVADWGLLQVQNPTNTQKGQLEAQQKEHDLWVNMMQKTHQHYLKTPHPILKMINDYPDPSDTFKVKDWKFNKSDIHLIGIRREQDAAAHARSNDDLFVLLVNGMVFKFWGSTDPSQSMAYKYKKDSSGKLVLDDKGNKIKIFLDEAFLVEGQHLYRFGWHKFTDFKKIYKALEPASNGVLIFRDKDRDNALTESDIKHGILPPNSTINIHWSGIGSTNFSAGCQVISGKSYINHNDEMMNCSDFASVSYGDLRRGRTKGAYNVLADLILAYSPKGVNTIRYTLGRDEVLAMEPTLGANYGKKTLSRMKI